MFPCNSPPEAPEKPAKASRTYIHQLFKSLFAELLYQGYTNVYLPYLGNFLLKGNQKPLAFPGQSDVRLNGFPCGR